MECVIHIFFVSLQNNLGAMFRDVKIGFILISSLLLGLVATGQNIVRDRKLIVFSGVVVNQDNMEPISNVTIKMHGRSRGTISNKEGRFQISVYTGDTLDFSHVSYIKSTVIIPYGLEEEEYFVIKPMTNRTIDLPEVIVLPWGSREEFVREFVATAKPTEDMVRVKENLEAFKETMKKDWAKAGNEAPYRSDIITTMQRENYYNGQKQPWHFLDVGTWYRFIKSKSKK